MKVKVIILFLPFLFSCSAILMKERKVRFDKTAESDLVEVRAISNGSLVKENKNNTYTVRNREQGYIISASRKKHRTQSKVINPTKFNYLKIIDVLIPAVADVLLFTQDNGKLNAPIFFVGLFGWIGPFVGPWKYYEKSFTVPEPLPLPQRNPNQTFIQAIDYSIAVPKQNRSSYTYSNYQNFLDKKGGVKKTFKDSMVVKLQDYEQPKPTILDPFNLRDTNNTFFKNKISDLKLGVNITSFEENVIGSAKQINVKANLSLINNFNNKSLIDKQIDASANWSRSYSFQEGLNSLQRNDVIEDAIAKFLIDSEVQTALTNYKGEVVEQKKVTNEVVIPNSANIVKTLPEAVKAVVTIITKDGYGSGCIVSNNGYIITNSHVIANNDTSITVQLNDSTQHKATLIVANLKEDLALLKIDTTLNYLFGLDKTLAIEIGQEVYAIGASNIDDYSMSVSKGIISTIRKVDGQTFIQTDGSINRGNSGGALISKDGKLYGIITAKMIGDGIEGVGFAIPYTKIEEALNIKFQ
ncbi:MAG: trypsin-like peptidase domain-containing protein [Bacteroidetes bacterium]|nr:trypsin-like peptidase domain-containing protein [Bacteroidota bacterium]